jgi:hypothetical protein
MTYYSPLFFLKYFGIVILKYDSNKKDSGSIDENAILAEFKKRFIDEKPADDLCKGKKDKGQATLYKTFDKCTGE